MIHANGKFHNHAAERFLELASLFSAEIFVTLVAYADESGTHSGPGSDLLTVAGWVAPREDWVSFCSGWRRVLNKFSVKYFHFREWSNASRVARGKPPTSDFKKNPYKEWDQAKLDDFLFELASVAASGNKIIVGGYVPSNLLRDEQKSGATDVKESPHKLCIDHFFNSVNSIISRHRAPWKRLPIAFFFDHSTDTEWKRMVNESFDLSRTKHRQFRELAFAYKEDHLPLQAADMVAYRLRQRIERHVQWDFSDTKWPKLDNILMKSLNESYARLSEHEKDAILRRFFDVPKDATDEQILRAINSKRRDPI